MSRTRKASNHGRARKPLARRPALEEQALAFHQAGHIIIGIKFGVKVPRASLDLFPFLEQPSDFTGLTLYPCVSLALRVQNEAAAITEGTALAALAGPVASLWYQPTPAEATRFTRCIALAAVQDTPLRRSGDREAEAEKIWAEALAQVETVHDEIDTLAKLLFLRRTLDESDFREWFDEYGAKLFTEPDAEVRSRCLSMWAHTAEPT